jgi:hypothetical protein
VNLKKWNILRYTNFSFSPKKMENSLSYSPNTVRSVGKLMDKIGATCDQLIGVLEVSKDSVGSYGARVTEDVMSTEFVDRVVIYLLLLKKHLSDLRKHSLTQFKSEDEVHAIIAQLIEMGDALSEKMVENNYFNNTYGYLVEDILFAIKGINEKMPVRCEAMAY